MSTLEIVIALLSSSILTSLLTLSGSYFFSKIDFRHDYYKEIIKHRLLIYEDIVKINSALNAKIIEQDTGLNNYRIFTSGADHFFEYLKKVKTTIDSSIWINQETHRLLIDLANTLTEAGKGNIDRSSSKQDVRQIGTASYLKIKKIRISLNSSIAKDMLNLYKVEEFLRERQSD